MYTYTHTHTRFRQLRRRIFGVGHRHGKDARGNGDIYHSRRSYDARASIKPHARFVFPRESHARTGTNVTRRRAGSTNPCDFSYLDVTRCDAAARRPPKTAEEPRRARAGPPLLLRFKRRQLQPPPAGGNFAFPFGARERPGSTVRSRVSFLRRVTIESCRLARARPPFKVANFMIICL